jgi:RNA polymerase sigma factor (sigma-70 family)
MRYANNQEDARDILNEGFVKIFKYLERYQIGTSLESWMKKIIVNTAIDFYRKSIRHRSEELDTARHISTHDEDALSKCSVEEIMLAVKTLPLSYRTVFNLYAVEGYSHKEVADSLGITESTSRSNLVKARIKLQEILLATAKYTSYGK